MFFLLLLIPSIQQKFEWIELEELGGAYVKEEMSPFSLDSWWYGNFQKDFSRYLDSNLGFKELFVRSYNQFYYSVFGEAKSPGCVVGKEGQLFLESYLQDYNGSTFKGEAEIDLELDRMKYLQDYWKALGINFLLVHAPGKASMYPEHIPERYISDQMPISNYLYYAQKSKKMGIDHIDLNAYFQAMKDNTQYPLYPRNGVHWTQYGMYLGIDSITKKIEKLKDVDMIDVVMEEVIMSDSVVSSENDVEVTMNLLKAIDQPDLPNIHFDFDKENKTSPKVLVISDSYWMQVFDTKIHQNIFSDGGFWFYFKTAYPQNEAIASYDFKQVFLQQDVILLMGTEATMESFPYGFLDKAYETFLPLDEQKMRSFYLRQVTKLEEWSESAKIKARKNGVSFEEQVEAEANYMTRERIKQMSEWERKVMHEIKRIKTTPHLFEEIQKRALRESIHIDVKLHQYAIQSLKEKE